MPPPRGILGSGAVPVLGEPAATVTMLGHRYRHLSLAGVPVVDWVSDRDVWGTGTPWVTAGAENSD